MPHSACAHFRLLHPGFRQHFLSSNQHYSHRNVSYDINLKIYQACTDLILFDFLFLFLPFWRQRQYFSLRVGHNSFGTHCDTFDHVKIPSTRARWHRSSSRMMPYPPPPPRSPACTTCKDRTRLQREVAPWYSGKKRRFLRANWEKLQGCDREVFELLACEKRNDI